jgi:hypothetical protein
VIQTRVLWLVGWQREKEKTENVSRESEKKKSGKAPRGEQKKQTKAVSFIEIFPIEAISETVFFWMTSPRSF